jgi:hypothetical protein
MQTIDLASRNPAPCRPNHTRTYRDLSGHSAGKVCTTQAGRERLGEVKTEEASSAYSETRATAIRMAWKRMHSSYPEITPYYTRREHACEGNDAGNQPTRDHEMQCGSARSLTAWWCKYAADLIVGWLNQQSGKISVGLQMCLDSHALLGLSSFEFDLAACIDRPLDAELTSHYYR